MAPETQETTIAAALSLNIGDAGVNGLAESAKTTLNLFQKYDLEGRGFIQRSLFIQVLRKINLPDVEWLMEASEILEDGEGNVDYKGFVRWIMTDESAAGGRAALAQQTEATGPADEQDGTLPEAVSAELLEVAASLKSMAHSLGDKDLAIANALLKHAGTLNALCGIETATGLHLDDDRAPSPEDYAQDHDAFAKLMQHSHRNESEEAAGFREQAAQLLERTGSEGSIIDDLQEVPVSEIKDKLAISYWRFCTGLRLYRSETVTQALRLICSAPVPGLGKTSYLDVFQTLTESAAWENHIYLFGGLVRDILRRTVGNDIDIGFSAPAAELNEICKSNGYSCSLDGDYILIGDEKGEEYLEGMVISFNGIQPPEHADFSMNTLFYDFKNDVLIDKTSIAIPAVVANRLDLPCPSDRWKSWLEINGVRVCFRYYKFLLRGYTYHENELIFVVKTLLEYWSDDAEHTVEVGRIALGNLVSSTATDKIEKLRQLVEESFAKATGRMQKPKAKSFKRHSMLPVGGGQTLLGKSPRPGEGAASSQETCFLSASSWWQKGWCHLLKLSPPKPSPTKLLLVNGTT